MTTADGYCVNRPVCRAEVPVRGYCESCRELRRLLSALHHDDDPERRGVSADEERDRRLANRRRCVMRKVSRRHYQ